MTDPLRTDRLSTPGDVPERDRDARVEELLLIGLDHYFAGQHELAISVWTRVLFLDRGHARARAYIERARGAIAERQRESEELLHSGMAAFDRGDVKVARQLLVSAVERGAASEEAVALLERLDRLELAARADGAVAPRRIQIPQNQTADAPARERSSRIAWITTGGVAGLAIAVLAAWLWTGARGWWAATPERAAPAAAQPRLEPLPVPSSAEAALTRAQRLHANGRLHDALDVLAAIRYGDPLRGQADALRATIQRQLLESAHSVQRSAGEGRSPGQ